MRLQIYIYREEYLFTTEAGPLLALKALVESLKAISGEEIDEAIAHIALVLDVARQVQEIVRVTELLINLLRQFTNSVLVGDVSDHHCGAGIVVDILREDLIEGPFFVSLVGVVIIVSL